MALAIYNPRSLTNEEVRSLYWEGGMVRKGHAPHTNSRSALVPEKDDHLRIRRLYPFLTNESKKIVRTLLLIHGRQDSSFAKVPKELLEDILFSAVFSSCKFEYEHDFDQNGVFFKIGKMAALQAHACQSSAEMMVTPLLMNEQWTNPASAGFVNVLCSSSQDCSVTVVCGRQGERGSTKPVPNSWLGVDLGPSCAHLSCSAYTFSCNKFDNSSRALRNWEFQGSMDGETWELIRKHDDDCSIPDSAGASATFEVDCKGRMFRQFRIVQTGPNSYRSTHGYIEDNVAQLTFGNLEL